MTMIVSTLLPVSQLSQAAIGSADFNLHLVASQIDVTPEGTAMRLDWPQISGATEIALDSASITLFPPSGVQTGLSLGELRGAFSGNSCSVTISDGPRPVRSLYLSGMRLNDGSDTELPNRSTLNGLSPRHRLAVAVEVDGVLAPVSMAVPDIDGSPGSPPYTTPPLLTGARYSDYRLTLPDVTADKLWLMVVTGNDPEDFAPVSFAFDYVSAQAAPSPVDVSLLDADGAAFYSGAGPIVAATTIDARNTVQRALEAAIVGETAPSVELTVSARTTGQLGTYGITAAGEVRRVFDDKFSVDLEGATIIPEIPEPPLDTRTPDSASADLVIEHTGLRLHSVSDALPTASGGLSGPVVSMDQSQWLSLPPQAAMGEVLRRVGIFGYGLEQARLSLRVLGAAPDGTAVAPPDLANGTCDIAAPDLTVAQRPGVQWFDLGEGMLIDSPIGFEVSAVSGRFLWVAEGGVPLVRLAVSHSLTGAETIRIGSQDFSLTDTRTTLNGVGLTPSDYAAPFEIASEHFATVTLSRLTLGYAP